jgi:hypothetical protein
MVLRLELVELELLWLLVDMVWEVVLLLVLDMEVLLAVLWEAMAVLWEAMVVLLVAMVLVHVLHQLQLQPQQCCLLHHTLVAAVDAIERRFSNAVSLGCCVVRQ